MNEQDERTGPKLSILLFGTQIAIGGAQKVLLDQARWFHARGYKATAAFFYDKEGLHAAWQEKTDVPIHVLLAGEAGEKPGLMNTLRGLVRLWHLLRGVRFDVVEAFTHDSNLLAIPLAWLLGVPARIATHHGKIEGFSRWKEILHAWIVNHMADYIVAVSEQTRRKAIEEGIRYGKIVMVPNGIAPVPVENAERQSVRRASGVGEEDVFFLSVGRLVYQKAHEYLVAALPGVLENTPNVKVGICGDGVLRTDLELQISSLGLNDNVKLFGMQADVTKFLAAADVFVLPSRWEGLPIALLEAMSAGLPIIATQVEGVDQTVEHGVHGLIVPTESPDALAKAILQLCRDSEMRRRMGAAARRRVMESYTTDRMCEQYLALMRQGLGEEKLE
jgi:glycosyltransferase involved in cell wall biosynthesis